MIAGGAMAAVLLGGGGYAGYRVIGTGPVTPVESPSPAATVEYLAFTRTPAVPSPTGQPIISYSTAATAGNAHSVTVVKRVDTLDAQLAQDAATGARLNVLIDTWRNGADKVDVHLDDVLVASVTRSSDSSGELEQVVMYYATISIQYH